MPDGVNIPGGPSFAGTPQPPDVPCDPTGEGWRGPPGPAGVPGPPGPMPPGGPFLPLSGGHVTGKLQVGATGWLESIIGGTESNSDFVSLSPAAGSAGVFGTRTSDGGSTGGQGAWAIGGFAINNNTTAVQGAWGAYLEPRRYPSAGTTLGMEINVINEGDTKQNQPYYMGVTGSTVNLWLSAGRGDVPSSTNNSLAIGIIPNGAMYDRGIMFSHDSVSSGVALGLPPSYSITWYLNDGGASQGVGVPAALIRSDATSVSGLAHPPSLVFGNGSLSCDPGNNVEAAIFAVGLNTFQTTQVNGDLVLFGSGSEHIHLHGDTGNITASGSLTVAGATGLANLSATGPITFNGANSATTATAFLQANQNVFGVSPAGGQQAAWYAFNIGSDTADTTTAQGGGATGTYFGHTVSAGAKGGRTAQSTLLNQVAATVCPIGQYYVASGAFAQASYSAGGTSGAKQGALFASNIGVALNTGATNWLGACGMEIDIGCAAGTAPQYKNGLTIIQYSSDVVRGTVTDAALEIANQGSGAPPGWTVGLQFGGATGWWPFTITSTLIGTQAGMAGGPPMQALNGIDFSAIVFSAYAFNTTGYSVANDGHVTCNRGLAFGSHVAASVTDYSHHIDLYNTQVGICIDSGTSSTNYGSFATHNFTNASGIMMANINPTAVTSATAMQIGGTLGPTWTTGSGVPASTQPVGSLYSRVSTWAAGATLYISKGGGAWTAVASV